jgi:hypothetical protein
MNNSRFLSRFKNLSLAKVAGRLVLPLLILAFVHGHRDRSYARSGSSDTAICQTAQPQGALDEPLAVEIILPKNTFSPLEPIVATIKTTNTGKETLFLEPHISNYQIFDFEVDDISKIKPKRVPRTNFHFEHVMIPGKIIKNVKEEPGASFHTDMVVNLVSDMTASHPYSIVLAVPYCEVDPKV